MPNACGPGKIRFNCYLTREEKEVLQVAAAQQKTDMTGVLRVLIKKLARRIASR